MAVSDWEELDGSPTYKFRRDVSTASRKFKIPWSDIDTFVATVFPLSSSGFGSLAAVNGKAWFVSEEIDIEPFDDPHPGAGENPATYQFAVATVNYSTNPDGVRAASSNPAEGGNGQNRGDGSGPGGERGSTNNNPVEWVSHELSFGAEVITIPNHAVHFDGDDPGKGVHGVNAGLFLPTVEHRIKVIRSTTPPFSQIRSKVGKIGGGMGAGDGKVMFLGCEAVDATDGKTGKTIWSLTYHFSERSIDWRLFFDPNTGSFRRLLKRGGGPLFESAGAGVSPDGAGAWDELFNNLGQI